MKHTKRVLTQPASEKECAPIGLINFSNGRCAEQWTGSSRNGSVSSKQTSQLSSALSTDTINNGALEGHWILEHWGPLRLRHRLLALHHRRLPNVRTVRN
jgi:hypothetical protein